MKNEVEHAVVQCMYVPGEEVIDGVAIPGWLLAVVWSLFTLDCLAGYLCVPTL